MAHAVFSSMLAWVVAIACYLLGAGISLLDAVLIYWITGAAAFVLSILPLATASAAHRA